MEVISALPIQHILMKYTHITGLTVSSGTRRTMALSDTGLFQEMQILKLHKLQPLCVILYLLKNQHC